jgi:hypothetical protein
MVIINLTERPHAGGLKPSSGGREPSLYLDRVCDRCPSTRGILQSGIDAINIVVNWPQRQAQVKSSLLGRRAHKPNCPDGLIHNRIRRLVKLNKISVVGRDNLDRDHGDVNIVRDITKVISTNRESESIVTENISTTPIGDRQINCGVIGIRPSLCISVDAYYGELVFVNVFDPLRKTHNFIIIV